MISAGSCRNRRLASVHVATLVKTQHTALLQIVDQRGTRLIDDSTLTPDVLGQIAGLIPLSNVRITLPFLSLPLFQGDLLA